MKRKLTFLMLFMAFCSMISLGQNWGEVDPYAYDGSMNMQMVVSIDEIEQQGDSNLVLGAFCGGVLRGTATQSFEIEGDWIYFLQIFGNSTESNVSVIKFKLYDVSTALEYDIYIPDDEVKFINQGVPADVLHINFITPVAEVNGTVYGSLDAAIAAANANDEVKLLGDVTLSEELEITKAININLNSNEINGKVKLAIVGATITGTADNMTVTSGVEGYKAVYSNDVWALTAYNYVAQVGSNKYEKIQEAVNAASENATIVIIGDASDETVTVDKNLIITGSNVTLNNVAFNANGANELTVSGLSFTGNSWINSGTAEKLTVSGVTANVTPSNKAYTNSRSAFISLGRSEQQQLELYVTDCNIVANGGGDAILGWAAITTATLTGNTFGSETAYQTNSDCVKFMAIAQGAVFNITGNTIYSNYNGIVFGQNTTRDNAYTVNVDGNTFKGNADHIWIEISDGSTCHATIEATSNNTVNGNTFTYEDIKAHTDVIKSWTSYAGVDVVKNTDGKIIGGSFAHINELLIAEGYEFDEVKGTVIRSVSGEVAYRAYVHDNDNFEGVAVDLKNVYVKESLKVELFDANGNVLTTTTYAKDYPIDAESFSCLIVLDGQTDDYWNTVKTSNLTVANMPETIKVYVDGQLANTFNNALGAGTNVDETAKYKALDCVYKEAQIGTEYYATLAAAVKAVQEGETIQILAGELGEGTIKLPATLKNVTFEGAANHASVLKDMTIMAADGNSFNYEGLTFDGIVFENSRISITGWRTGGAVVKNFTVTNCRFFNLNDDTNNAPVHFNMAATEPVNGFTFTNNVIDGATGGQKSGVYAQMTGKVIFTNNTINNVAFRPYVIQLTTDDGIADEFTVTGNTFSGSAAGRAQGLGNNDEGTDVVKLTVSENIFKGITDAQQICYWNFNEATTTVTLEKNYYDIDILANPSKIYYNGAAKNVDDLVDMGVFPIYKELNQDGTININSAWSPDAVATVNGDNYYHLQSALDAAAAGTGNVTVEILKDIDLTDIDWNPVTVSAPGYPMVTVNGNGKTITGLNDMLFAGTWAGGSGLIINDLTIANSNIVNDKDDAKGTVGVGAFIGYPQASATVKLDNCHLKDSHVEGGHWTGGLIGMAGGYNGNDGPVFMNLTITGCSVTGSTITGKGSVGGIIGHGSCAAWTSVDINGTTVSGNIITSTGSSNVKAGAIMGTIGAAGQPTTANGVTKTGGAFISATVADNNVTSNGTAITTIYGRQGTETGILTLTAGGSYQNNPIEENVTYAVVAPGFKLEQNTNGTYGVVVDPAYGKVAKIDDTYYETLAEAIAAVGAGNVVIELVNDATLDYNAREAYGTDETTSLTINGNGKTLTLNQKNSDWSSFGLANAAAKVVFNNMTIEKTGYGDTDGPWNTHTIIFSSKVEMTDVTVNNSMAVQNGATLNNVTINEANGYYGLWINGNGQTVTMNGGSINATNGGRGIKIADQYIDAPALVTLSVTGTTFNTAKKAAVLVSSTAGAAIAASNVDITNVAEDKVNFAWVDEEWAAHYGKVTVTGGTVSQESVEKFNVTITDNNDAIQGYYENIATAIADAQAGETVNLLDNYNETLSEVLLIDKSLTINGNGKTLTSSATRVIRLTASGINVTIDELNMVSNAVRVGTNDVRGISIDIIDNVTLTLNNCSVDFTDASANDWAYAVNVTGGNEHNVTVNGGAYEGANVINVSGASNTIVVNDATLNCTYPNNDMYYGACIWVLQNQSSSVEATGNTFKGGNAVAFNIGTGTTLTESNNTDNTTIVVAKVDGTYYTSVNEAINAAADGATVQLLSRTISEYIAPWANDTQHTTEKSITVKGYDNFGTTLTGGLYLGYDDSQCRNHTIVVEGIAFEGKGLTVACQKDVTINNNTFNDITDSRAIAVIGKNINATVENNKIDGVQIGIELRNMAVATMTYNEVKNTTHNSVQVTAANPDADVTITGNTFENWGKGSEGRAIRVSGGDNIVINDNKMVNANAPESFVKITKLGETVQEIDASRNYWNDKNPLALFETDGAADPVTYLINYYADAGMQNLIILSASIAKVGNEYYQSLQAAVDAADENNNTVTLLTSATGAGVVIDKDVTIDFNGKTYTVNQAVGSAGTETLGFQILKNNNVTLKKGTLTSSAAVEGSNEIKMLIQNYANLTLTDMNLVDNTDHILYALSNNSGISSIEGATNITTDAVAFDVYDYTAGGYTVPTVNVSTTGKITGDIEVSETATLKISAGTFTVEIAEAWCADGFIPKDNGDGTYGVEPGVFVARVNGKGYTTINAAIAAAQEGETVTILAGNYEQTLNINKAITVQGERNDQNENLVNITGQLNITADGATAKNLNVNNGVSSAGYINAKGVTVDGCTVVGGNGFRSCYTTGLVTFKNSTITGSTYGIHFDGSADGNIVIENCDITGWTSFASTITNVAISNTEFLNGNYNQLRFYQNAQMTGCKFNEAMTIDFGMNDVDAEFEGCAVVDTEGNETDAPLTDVIYLGDIAEMGIDVTIDNEPVVVESRITRVNEENKEEHRYFLELTDALADVKDGETITLFADINEAVNVKTLGKEIVFDGNDNNFTMTAGMIFGNDDNNGDNGKITVKNVNFANANAKAANNGLTLIELAEVTVDNCNFTNITGDAIAVISDNLTETITITNNVIDGATGAGINLRTPKAATVKDNVIKNVGGNAMTFQHDSDRYDAEGDIIVTGNLMENWANNAAEGRAIRLASGSKARTFTIENNAMVKANAPEEFVKITTAEGAQATISIDKNYWNGQSPLNENVYLAEGVFPTNYYGEYQYANETLTFSNLLSINYVAQVNGVKYPSLAAAVDAAQAGETVTLLGDATGAGVVINKDITIDFATYTYTVNQAVGSEGTVTLGFQILKDNYVTLKNGTLTSTAVTSGKEVKMLIQNYANLTLTNMNLVDNTDHILYALSNNSGTSNINGTTSITTDKVAFDVYDYSSAYYEVPTVNVSTTGKITGKIEVSESISNNLNISAGTFTVEIKEAWCADGFIPKYNDDGTWTVKEGQYVARIGETGYEELDKAFAAAQDNDEVKILVAGTYALTTSGKDITITGAVDGVVFDNIGAKNMGGANVTFNNVTFDYYPNVNYTGLQHSGDLVYNNCTINGQVFLYGTSETFNECIFNQNSADAYNVWTYGAKDVDFIECTFNSVGKSVLIYAEGASIFNNVNVTECTFNASAPVDGKAAIEMDSSLTAGINLTIDDATTATGFDNGNVSGNSLWNNKKGNETEANNDITVVVNNETVLAPLTLVAAAGGTNYTSLQAAYNAVAANGTITILNDATGAGLVIDKNVTIDFNEKTYTFNEGVGSGTLTSNGFQILQGNTVVLKNGGLNVAEAAKAKFYILVQNYANLTVEDMTLDGTNLDKWSLTDGDSYVLSNNSGIVNITGKTNITANNDGDKAFAFDVCKYANYAVPTVNVNTTGTIAGKIEVSSEIPTNLNISGGTFTVEIAEAWCADGYIPVKNADNTWSVVPGKFVAQVNGVKYPSLAAAVEAAQANETVTLLTSATGAGVVIDKNVTIDFGGFTYSFNEGVGSTGTETNGFQILQGNDVVLKNGKLEVAAEAADKFYILVQNYANLTVEDMTLDGTNLDKWSLTDGDSYVLSNNSGTVNITGATNITANNDGDKAFAFDVCKYANYAVPTVNVNTTGIIAGKIEVSPEIPTNLNISGGTFYIDFLYEDWCAEYYSPVQDEQNSNIWTVELTGGELSRSFNKNWNWFSSYVDLSASDGSGVEKLQNALGTSGIQIKGRADGYVNYEAGEWHGSLSSILKGNMYMIKTSQAISEDGFKIAGTFVDHEEIAIELSYGWNWISYPVRESVGLSDALKDFNPKEGDQIKSYSNGFAQYSNNEWQGSLATMIPGQGYMYKSNNSTKYVYYNVPETGSRAALKANVTAEDNHWAPTSNYANNMTMIAMLNIDGEMSGNDYEIAAFANGECRGSARPIYVESVDAYMLFMTIYGEEVENLSFKYYDLNYGTEYELSDVVVYSDDAAVGSIEEPYMFNLDFLGVGETSFDEISIYPNPTTTKAEINLNATCEKVEVFNALGVKVAEYANVDTIDALETAGVYVIRITNNNDVKNCRLVVK